MARRGRDLSDIRFVSRRMGCDVGRNGRLRGVCLGVVDDTSAMLKRVIQTM